MPRRPRIQLPGVPQHIIQRGNNRQACFYTEEDYRLYLEWLAEYAKKAGCQIHSYVLMTNHVHLLVSSVRGDGTGVLMKALGQRYVQYVNRQYRRSGTLWEGRFRSCLVQDDAYLLSCQRYIETNPVRAGMVEHPGDYPWSSYACNGQGQTNPAVSPHLLYQQLGATPAERRKRYRALFKTDMNADLVDEIRSATNGNYVLGSERFAEQIAQVLGRRVVRGKAGRPRQAAELRP
ncbi:transposase [Solimonas marina]|uniref:Transposase n=1 Tax=Solimonas marina TaxID=2714601 RepID=A0A969W8M9_9GAMM|nr:transposase [Solimonas marina]NKF21929.1 transposase [Solimonas marina]